MWLVLLVTEYEYESDSDEDDDDDDDDDEDDDTASDSHSPAKDIVSEDRLSNTTESSSDRKHGFCDDSKLYEISASSPKKARTDVQPGSGEAGDSSDSCKENTSALNSPHEGSNESNGSNTEASNSSVDGLCGKESDNKDGQQDNCQHSNSSDCTSVHSEDGGIKSSSEKEESLASAPEDGSAVQPD